MARWGVSANKGSASVKSVLLLTAAASSPRRARVHDVMIGCNASPADNPFILNFQRCSTAGTGTTLTPNALDPADAGVASTIVATATVTSDPTLTANAFLYSIPFNQRSTVRWVAAPYSELVIPATASNGIMFGLSAASTTDMQAGAQYEEL